MLSLEGRKKGDNLTLLNTFFLREKDDKGKFHESMTIIYKDVDSGLKYKEEIEKPTYEFYLAQEGKRVNYNRLFISETDCELYTPYYSKLEESIARLTYAEDFFYYNISNGNRRENRKLHLHPDIFNSDMNIDDHYRFRFDKEYSNQPIPVSVAFFDIEVDGINMISDFPQPGECPINSISVILKDQQKVFSLLLRSPNNPQIEDFENEVKSNKIFNELNQFVIDAVGGPEMANKYGINFEYNFLFYDVEDEINLIKDLFSIFNSYKPDFALAWNMAFDIPYIIARIIKLGYIPEDIMCHPDFTHKSAVYFVDERMKNEYAERSDYGIISSYTVYLDQMIHFASRRKGQSKFLSFSLDYIGEVVAGVRKLDYKHITTDIMQLPYKSFKTFVFYNIMDTIVQYCIEACTGDLPYLFTKSLVNNTRYNKVHRQTVYLANRATKEFYKEGFIIGNNVNKFNEKPDVKFPGAFVADPMKVNDYSRYRIYGRPVNIFDNDIDLDYSALYPSIIREWNIAPNTQIGLMIINDQVHANENKHRFENWNRAGEFMEDFQSHVWLEVCKRWFGLAGYAELYEEFKNCYINEFDSNNDIEACNDIYAQIPYIRINNRQIIDPLIIENEKNIYPTECIIQPDLEKWKEFIDDAIKHPNQHF